LAPRSLEGKGKKIGRGASPLPTTGGGHQTMCPKEKEKDGHVQDVTKKGKVIENRGRNTSPHHRRSAATTEKKSIK